MSNEIQFMREIAKLQGQIDALRTVEIGKPYLEDLKTPAVPGLRNPVSAKPDYDYTNIGFLFDASDSEHIYFNQQMPHNWVAGGLIYPHVHWEPTNTNTGDVRWVMTYKWTNINAVEAGSATTIAINATAVGTALTHQYSEFAAIDGTGKTSSSIISIDLWRYGGYAGDTYNTDALLKEFDIHVWLDPNKSYWAG